MPEDIAGELAVLEGEMGDHGSRYWREPERQQRYLELTRARLAHRAAPAPAAAGPAAERREIEGLMRDGRSPYWRGPRAETLQSRYRELLIEEGAAPAPSRQVRPPDSREGGNDAEEAEERGGESWRATAEDIVEHFGYIEGCEGFDTETPEEEAVLQAEIGRAQDNFAAILRGLGRDEGAELVDAFDLLPPGVQAADFAALGRPEPIWAKTADAGELAAFRGDASCGGAQLVAHWGSEAPRRLGNAMSAFNDARDLLSADDRVEFDEWWRGRAPRMRQIVLWKLGEPAQ